MEGKVEGRVKWFNAKSGYGFVTLLASKEEVFVHHTGLRVGSEQFRYLVEGEYVELEVSETSTGVHKYQGVGVTGIKGGKLMCETRSEASTLSSQHKVGAGAVGGAVVGVREGRVSRAGGEWKEVREKRPERRQKEAGHRPSAEL
jgi:CspA family cold shock protein